MSIQNVKYTYFAFISYSSKDTAWGKRLQSRLENFRLPTTLCRQHQLEKKPLNPIFFAPSDIQPGGLSKELQERLRASKNLIVIGSPNSAQSEWVGREIEFFHKLGRTDCIHYFIVDGTPHSGLPDTECFNPIVEQLGIPEILGANVNEKTYRFSWMNRERAYIQLISKLLGVEFDEIWQRQRRRILRKAIAMTLAVLAAIAMAVGAWWISQPFDAHVSFIETDGSIQTLPPIKSVIVSLTLDNETKTDTIAALNEPLTFANIPRRFLGKSARIHVECFDNTGYKAFLPLDTLIVLNKRVELHLKRDAELYGTINFEIDNAAGVPMSGVEVTIAGVNAVSDKNGKVSLRIPIEKQNVIYQIRCNRELEYDSIATPCSGDEVRLLK